MNFESLRNYGRAFGGALAGVFAKTTYDHAYSTYGFWLATAFGAIAFILAIAILILFYVALQRSRRWRKLTNRNAQHEGFWLQRVYNDRPYSISQISFDVDRSVWLYSGVGFLYDPTAQVFKVGATWHSESLHYDEKARRWYFSGTAKLLDPTRIPPSSIIAEGRVMTTLDLSKKYGDTIEGIITDDIANATDIENVMAFYMRMFPADDRVVGMSSDSVRLEDLRETQLVEVMHKCYNHYHDRLKELG